MEKNEILELSFDFALMVIDYSEKLFEDNKYLISRQLLKSGTSIGANVSEAQSAESRPDFIHKMKIARKEVYETLYWLKICHKSEHYSNPLVKLLQKLESIRKLLNAIIYSTILNKEKQ